MLDRAKFYDICGKEWLFPTIQDAVHHAQFSNTLVSHHNTFCAIYVCVIVFLKYKVQCHPFCTKTIIIRTSSRTCGILCHLEIQFMEHTHTHTQTPQSTGPVHYI